MTASDSPIMRAIEQVTEVRRGAIATPRVQAFFDEPTFTVSYVVSDPESRRAAIIDSVWKIGRAHV